MLKYKVYINKEQKIIVDNLDSFLSDHTLINAAGGLVYNSKYQLLMIYRNDTWDLPKGKLEDGESIKECAIREVEEECGVSNLRIVGELDKTYHTYSVNGKKILKCTYWYKMSTKYNNSLVPQTEEGITKVEWVNQKDIAKKLENTYCNVKELLKK